MTNSANLKPAPKDARRIPASILALATILAFALLAAEKELRLAVPLLAGVTATATILLAVMLYSGERGRISLSPTVILGVALLLRLLFLCGPPQLSDDIYRYLWDGSNTLRGVNPYAASPAKLTPPVRLAGIHARINHPQYVTIYPPTAQLVFAGGALFGGTITDLKTLLVLLDLGQCALLVALLQRLELPAWRAALYAWNPLAVIEIAGSGHVDGAGLTLLLGSICLLVMNQKNSSGPEPRTWPLLISGALFACAGLVKLFPFVLAPVLLLMVPAGQRRHFITGFIAALAALLVAFLPGLVNMLTSLDVYARNWEFAGFAFNSLRGITGSGTTARLLLTATFLLAVAVTVFRLASNLKGEQSPISRGRLAMETCYAIVLALLLLTPTLQPWYALCLAAFLPFCAGPAGLVLCWVVFLTYQVQIPYFILGQWVENPYVTAAVFLAPITAGLLGRFMRTARQNPAE